MPTVVTLHDKAEIETFARRNPAEHLFEIGDLDDAYWPHTIWYGWREGGNVRQLALVYTSLAVPVLMANPDPPRAQMRDFLRALLPLLPRRTYAHLAPDTADVLAEAYHVEARGVLWKMILTDQARVDAVDTAGVDRLSEDDAAALVTLYSEAYPDSRFDPRLLQTGRYYGVRDGDLIVSAGGVHVYSPVYRVAALGNVATHPAARGRGLGTKVSAALCQALRADGIDLIGLIVTADNATAISVYGRLGFEKATEVGAYTLEAR